MARWIKWALFLLLLFILASLGRVVYLYTEWLWFKEVGFTSVFWVTLLSKLKLALAFGIFFFILLYGNILIARRLAPKYVPTENEVVQLYRTVARPYFDLVLLVISLFFSLLVAGGAAEKWISYLRFLNQTPFGLSDPIFKRDIAFYVFSLPLLKYIWAWLLVSLIITTVVAVLVHWFDGAIRVRRYVQKFAPHVKAHLSVLCGLIFLVIAWGFQLNIYELLYSPRGAAFGAGYTDLHAQLPALRILIFMAVICAALFLINIYYRGWRLPLTGIALLLVTLFLVGIIYPAIVQQYRVSPNEIAKEKPYIELNIKYTRQAYNLDRIKEEEFPVSETLTLEDIRGNEPTIRNVRLWDWRPLKKTFSQIQEIRLYYSFRDVDIDRYKLNGDYRQVAISPRELVPEQLPETARTWINEHLVYTHGHGLVMNPVSTVTPEGLPDLLIKDIPPKSKVGIKVGRPEIYYGEVAGDYVVVKTKTLEFDYPKGDKNQYTTYKGSGGVPVGSPLGKMVFAWRFGSLKLLVSDAITSRSRVMYHRQIGERVRNIAPFLSYDKDPYLVISGGRLYWIQDAYTLTDMYPYSEPFGSGNYIRNSVKVVIDAYNGDVIFYIVDEKDPLVKTYARIFPTLFKPFKAMPSDLRSHIRYPEDLFMIQARMYATYHMRDPQVFYNKEDLWAVPKEIYEQSEQEMEPYYIIMRLPGHPEEEFILMLLFTPASKGNMIAWICAKCDMPNYGDLLVYKFPKQKLVYGPSQVEARIDQDPEISKQLTLWGQRGSSVIRSNLLVIPIEDSLLYVEPLYLQAEQTALPELTRVIIAHGDRVTMEESLEEALLVVFGGRAEARPEEKLTEEKLIEAAVEHFNKAIEYQREGNWAGYGEEIKKLEETLKMLKERT
ncbi:MAG: UPF0182 family protein [Actinomycetota bacterium]|nr:UPF0182 family protein [Actinomycetota bacterium]